MFFFYDDRDHFIINKCKNIIKLSILSLVYKIYKGKWPEALHVLARAYVLVYDKDVCMGSHENGGRKYSNRLHTHMNETK